MSPKVKQRLKHNRREEGQSEVLRSFCRIGRITNEGLDQVLRKLRSNPDLLNFATRITGMKC